MRRSLVEYLHAVEDEMHCLEFKTPGCRAAARTLHRRCLFQLVSSARLFVLFCFFSGRVDGLSKPRSSQHEQ